MVVGTLSARYGSLFLGHHYGDKFELHHHIEDGMVILTVAPEQINGDEYMVRTHKLSGEKMFDKKLDCTKSN